MTMRQEEFHKDVYRRVIEAVSQGDSDALDGLMAQDMVDHNPIPDQTPGLEGFKQWMTSARASFPDFQGTVEDVIAEGDRVAGRITWRGTHQGTFLGLLPTNREVAISAFHIVRFADDRVADWWGTADLLGGLMQLGASIATPDS
jgi:steroid delta-isomerase-like uncharacterized protein